MPHDPESPPVGVTLRAVRRLRAGHPWIFRDDLRSGRDCADGEVVALVGPDGRSAGRACYSARSKIALRLLTRDDVAIDESFWRRRADAAAAYREVVMPGAEACRLVHGDTDGLPGLIVDRYAEHLVVQQLTAAAVRFSPIVLDELGSRCGGRSILARNDVGVRRLEGLPLEVRQLQGTTPTSIVVSEGEVRMTVDPWHGQKTGAFLDQRDNRLAVGRLAHGRVLDLFCYQGAFALHAARRAERVIAIDSSAPALVHARADAAANGLTNLETLQGSVFDEARALERAGERFDVVLVDPPAFAKRRSDLAAARTAYREVNVRAMRLLRAGGILVTSSCSYNLDEAGLIDVVRRAAADSRREARLIAKGSQSPDHPIRLGFPESHYLKCLTLRVM